MHLIPVSGFPVIWHNAVGSGALAAEVLRLICDFWINTLGADRRHRAVSIGAIYVPEGHDTDPRAITKALKTCITADAAVFGADGGILPFQIRIIHLPVAKTAVGAVGKQIGFKIDHILRITGAAASLDSTGGSGAGRSPLLLLVLSSRLGASTSDTISGVLLSPLRMGLSKVLSRSLVGVL